MSARVGMGASAVSRVLVCALARVPALALATALIARSAAADPNPAAPSPPPLTDEELVRLAAEDAAAGATDAAGASDETIEITSEQPVAPAQTKLDASAAQRIPGTSGDALRVVQMLPGVARASVGGEGVVVWGAAAQDTRVRLDGVPVPWLYHRGGWRSIVPSIAVEHVALAPAGFGVDAGQAIGGMIDVATRVAEDRPGTAITAAADLLDGELAMTHRGRRISAQAYGRAGWLRAVVKAVDPQALDGGLVAYPRWWDAGGAVALDRGGEQFTLRLVAAGDDVARALVVGGAQAGDDAQAGAAAPSGVGQETSSRRVIRAMGGWSERSELGTTRWTVWGGVDRDERLQRRGAAGAAGNAAHGYSIDTQSAGVTGQRLARVGRQLLTAGLEAEWFRDQIDRRGSLANPPREGDPYIYGQPLGVDDARDAWTATTAAVAPWVRLDYVREGLLISPGIRVDGYVLGASRLNPPIGATPQTGWQTIAFTASPRLEARWQRDGVIAAVQGGRYLQPRRAMDTSAVFGTPTLEIERAWHAVATLKVRISDNAPIEPEVVVWGRWMNDLVVRAEAAAPVWGQALVQDGRARARGIQVVARLRPQRLGGGVATGWTSYNFTHGVRSAHGESRKFDVDQPHAFAVAGSYQRGAWGVGGRFWAASGNPRTPVAGRYYDTTQGAFAPIAGAVNTARLPAFAQLDLRIERAWATSRWLAAVALEAQNVLGRDNVEAYAYDAAWETPYAITGTPRLIWLAARVAWRSPRRAEANQ